jgi:hypothetical protein
MDEGFKKYGLWIGLGAMAVIFLCIMLCGAGAMISMIGRSIPTYAPVPHVAPPAAEDGSAPPQAYYYPPAPYFGSRYTGFGLFGFLFRVVCFGLVLLLVIGLFKRLLWGRRHWRYRFCGPPFPGKPPKGGEPEQDAAEWGPWAWHRHHRRWGPPPWWGPEPESGKGGAQPDSDTENSEYTGPQE